MSLHERDRAALYDIHDACGLLADLASRITLDDMLVEWIYRAAAMYELVVIGEATKRLSDEFREAHAPIPWLDIAGLRNVLVHGYDKVDVYIVWDIVERDAPALHAVVAEIIATEE